VRRCALLVLALAAVALPSAAPAAADDASLRAAADSRDAQAARLGKQIRRAYRAWKASGFRSRRLAHRIIRINRRARAMFEAVEAAVRAEQPSTPRGERYKRLVQASNRQGDAALRWDSRAVRRFLRERLRAAEQAWRRAELHANRSLRLARRARRLFEG
jgi:hypothetical protein